MNAASVVGTIIGGRNTQPQIVVWKDFKLYAISGSGNAKIRALAIAPRPQLGLMPITSHLATFLLPNNFHILIFDLTPLLCRVRSRNLLFGWARYLPPGEKIKMSPGDSVSLCDGDCGGYSKVANAEHTACVKLDLNNRSTTPAR